MAKQIRARTSCGFLIALVDGVAGETPPLERLRQTGDEQVLRLLVDLYHSQNLAEDGGIPRRVVYQTWERFEAGQFGEFIVWSFAPPLSTVACAHDLVRVHLKKSGTTDERFAAFWLRLGSLLDCGVIEWVPFLFESDDADAEIIHALISDCSGSREGHLASAALRAGIAMLTQAQFDRARQKGAVWIIPVKRHVRNVQLIGVARLRYRPHTKMTGAWWAEVQSACEVHIGQYEKLIARASPRCSKDAAPVKL
jgi:hypothetical protein